MDWNIWTGFGVSSPMTIVWLIIAGVLVWALLD
jgi:hypothetical protein